MGRWCKDLVTNRRIRQLVIRAVAAVLFLLVLRLEACVKMQAPLPFSPDAPRVYDAAP